MKHSLNINGLIPKLPIIQGGMGVGISLHNLAGHVAKAGGIGIISSAQIGYRAADFLTNTLSANLTALKEELTKARAIAPQGIIGVNIMVALSHYEEMVKQAISAGADLIISGAGLPVNLPLYAKRGEEACETNSSKKVKLAPIVSSGKAAKVICKLWDRKHQVAPDMLVVEGPLAGGHLGFSVAEIEENPDVLDIMEDVKAVAHEYGEKYSKHIPVVVAGGFYSGNEVALALKSGADGVQMATRFVTTYECDAAPEYKDAYINASPQDIIITKSPVGMPGRAINNALLKNIPGNKACFYHCLEKCDITTIPYCISKVLISAAKGDLDNALLFCGTNAHRATKLEHVQDIFTELDSAIQTI